MYSLTNERTCNPDRRTRHTVSALHRFLKEKYLFKISGMGDSHIFLIHVTWIWENSQLFFFWGEGGSSDGKVRFYNIKIIKMGKGLNRVSYNVSNFYEWVYTMHEKSLWKVVFEVKRGFISCNDIAFFKMSWYRISPPCCRSDESSLHLTAYQGVCPSTLSRLIR